LDLPDAELLSAAAAGDAEAMRSLLLRHGPKARGAIRGRIAPQWQSVLDEDDVMQVVYMEAFLHITRVEADNAGMFVNWLKRIAVNALHDAIRGLERKKRPQPNKRVQTSAGHDSYVSLLDQLALTGGTPSMDVARGEAGSLLENAIEKLPPDYSRVVRLYDLEGRSPAEVAESTGRSIGAVHMLRARAHDRLRELLGSESQFFLRGA
jgi:RNA polymerase sigma factor (sigma-70 family)